MQDSNLSRRTRLCDGVSLSLLQLLCCFSTVLVHYQVAVVNAFQLLPHSIVPTSFAHERRQSSSSSPSSSCPSACSGPWSSSSSSSSSLFSSAAAEETQLQNDEAAIQWELFQRYHARNDDISSYKGIWTTYDYMGDVIHETVASVDYTKQSSSDKTISIQQSHCIVVGAKRSDCATCFDSMETKSFPVATYSPETLLQKRVRCAACSLVHGPSLLRSNSGIMATELCLSQGDGRVRVMFQHAPVWQKGVEPGSCPPQGLKLIRCMISREAMRDTAPTEETEAAASAAAQAMMMQSTNEQESATNNKRTTDNPIFYRPVSPFHWHKQWSGSSWTWGPQAGNRGWAIEELDEADSWHGNAPVECWNLRLPGGIFVQAPRVVTDSEVGLCRLAWLPTDETLLRVEAGVLALQPIMLDEEDMMVGFEPPSLASLRCDMLKKIGDLQGEPKFITDRRKAEEKFVHESENRAVQRETQIETPRMTNDLAAPMPVVESDSSSKRDDPLDSEQAVRDAIQL